MLDVEDLDKIWGLIDTIINQDRRVDQTAYAGLPFNHTADIWKTVEKLNMIQYGVAESFGTSGKVGPRIGKDSLKVG